MFVYRSDKSFSASNYVFCASGSALNDDNRARCAHKIYCLLIEIRYGQVDVSYGLETKHVHYK